MIGRNPKPEDLKLKIAINRVLDNMDTCEPTSAEFSMLIVRLERLNEMLKTKKSWRNVSPDQALLVAGNLLGILVIVAYEQKHVMVSKAIPFIMKGR